MTEGFGGFLLLQPSGAVVFVAGKVTVQGSEVTFSVSKSLSRSQY